LNFPLLEIQKRTSQKIIFRICSSKVLHLNWTEHLFKLGKKWMNTLNWISLGNLNKQMFKVTIRLLIIIHGVPKNNFPNDSLNFIIFLNVQIITSRSKCSLACSSKEVTRACFPSLCRCHQPGVWCLVNWFFN